MKKYEITDIAHPDNPNLHRIRAVTDLTENVLAGMLGGYVESRDNLDQAGRAWISADAIACENAVVCGDAILTDYAVAKGCASDNAIEAMRQAGVESGIISLGGNVQTLGLKPDGSKWTVAIQDPNNTSSYVGVINVGETAVITSGSYQRNFTDTHGKFYHHILKPSTGYPVTNSLVSVTIICTDGVMADCLSTAMFVLGETAALNYWRTYGGFEMVLITSDNRIICTSGLLEEFTLSNSNYTLSYSE